MQISDTYLHLVSPVSIDISIQSFEWFQSPFPSTRIHSDDARRCWARKDCLAMRHGRFGHPRNSGGWWTSRPGRFWPSILINQKWVTLRICRESASDRSLCEMESQVWALAEISHWKGFSSTWAEVGSRFIDLHPAEECCYSQSMFGTAGAKRLKGRLELDRLRLKQKPLGIDSNLSAFDR